MPLIDVPAARLHYETYGNGPRLIMIPGASGAADPFRKAASQLAQRYTVVLYDRRGFSRSTLEGPQDYQHRLDTDADDIALLIGHLTEHAVTVFGASSGATVGLRLLERHPSIIETLVPFEAPAVRLLPDGQHWVDFFHSLYDLYRESGMSTAMQRFRDNAVAPADRAAMARAVDLDINPRARANADYWFEHELRQYPAVEPSIDTLAATSDRIVPAVGALSTGYPARQATEELAKQLGIPVTVLPGGHVGCVTHASGFAIELADAIAQHNVTRTPR